MASTIFRIAVSSSRTKICCFRSSTLNRITPKLILPSCATTVTQRSVLHTSECNKQEQLFHIQKNRAEGATHWMNERLIAVGIIALMPPAYFFPHVIIDHAFAVLLPLHSYWGVKAIIADYLPRPIVPAVKVLWTTICVLSGVGLVYLNVNDVGITELFRQLITL